MFMFHSSVDPLEVYLLKYGQLVNTLSPSFFRESNGGYRFIEGFLGFLEGIVSHDSLSLRERHEKININLESGRVYLSLA